MLKLGRLRIENFKSFIEPIFFNFSERDLILFDGPNGFGKTTIFDAIELCFTGKVHRIQKTDTKTKSDHILKGDNNRRTSIKLELLDAGDTRLVIEVVIPENISGEKGKVAKYKSSIKRYEFSEWNTEAVNYSEAIELNLAKLKLLLNNEKLDSTFTLFNYIQQEETCYFLKLNENERHLEISHLFGTKDETEKSRILDTLATKLKEKSDSYRTTIIKEEIELKQLSKPTIEEKNPNEQLGSEKIASLSDLSKLTVEQIKSYKENLEGVGWILSNYQTFQDQRFNSFLRTIVTNRRVEVSNFIKIGSTTSYDEIEKLHRQYMRWKKTCSKLNFYTKLIKTFDSKPNTLTKEILYEYNRVFADQYSRYLSDIASYDSLKKGCDSSSILLAKIDESRKNLISHYEGHINNGGTKSTKETKCPLCGDPKSSWQALLDEYEKQAKYLEEQLGENDKLLADVTKKLIEQLVIPLVAKMRRFTSRYAAYTSYDFETVISLKYVEKAEFDSMARVKDWLVSNVEGCLAYQDKKLRDMNPSYKEMNEEFVSFIERQGKSTLIDEEKDYSSFSQDLKALELSFDSEGKLIVDSDDIRNDLLLLSRIIVQKSTSAYKIKEKNILKLKEKMEKLSLKRDEIVVISKIYKRKIKAYEKDVAKNIAIPLFVYSSKILQSRPEGSGIFLITPSNDNSKGFMQFSATGYDSHDAWNTMSSGQLSGVVISFMLAMNKVYPSNLSTLLIDDPVQTMDEVNMASFVQLLRYEFPMIQFLISTHESKVASYFNYKISGAGLKTLPINMKNELLNR